MLMSLFKGPRLILLPKRYKTSKMSLRKFFASNPSSIRSCSRSNASFSFPSKISLNSKITFDLSARPSIFLTSSSSITLLFKDCEIRARSNNETESLTEPSEVLAINLIASSLIFPFSFREISFK